jgi:CubicO group peptidase (beta-lactamase class C family)
MVAFGELYLNRGRARGGTVVLPEAWVERSWIPRTRSDWTGNEYGYGWWIRDTAGHTVYYAWGFGGQFIFVVPDLALVVVATSDAKVSRRDFEHRAALYRLLDDEIVPALAE